MAERRVVIVEELDLSRVAELRAELKRLAQGTDSGRAASGAVVALRARQSLRSASRVSALGLALLAVLAIAVLAAIGIERLTSRMTPRSRRLTTVLICALLVAEFAAVPLSVVPYRIDPPAVDRWVCLRMFFILPIEFERYLHLSRVVGLTGYRAKGSAVQVRAGSREHSAVQ